MSTVDKRIHHKIAVKSRRDYPARGWLRIGHRTYCCALGRSGIVTLKHEGDGGTPRGQWRFERIMYRADRLSRPQSPLPVDPINRDDGWCDDPASACYNCQIRLPSRYGAEALTRADHLYDVFAVLSHNRNPRVRNRGSAIFMHVALHGYQPTEGCVALKLNELLTVLEHVDRTSLIEIG